ncbi:hypothetical protein SpCBS45565_g04053 [Spizellomyces sp. 'palustris']|nr:hypothetical protein SpCBS45565_g04053 [Spizellomyces sp. 'palustris']
MSTKRKRAAVNDPSPAPPESRSIRSVTPGATPEPGQRSKKARMGNKIDHEATVDGARVANGSDIQGVCRRLFDVVRYYKDDSGRLLAEPYLQLPPRTQFPDYDEVIAKPIAMNSIQARLDHNKYKSIQSFRTDVELVFENAKKYNQPQSRIYKDAVFLLQRFRTELENVKEEGLIDELQQVSEGKENVGRKNVKITAKKAHSGKDLDALISAIEMDDLKAVKGLLAKGLDVNTLTEANLFGAKFTWAPLHAAAYFGRCDIATELIDHGAGVELSDTWYQSKPLGWAAYGGNLEMCQVLVDKYNADTEFENIGGQTALDMVADPDVPGWTKLLSKTSKTNGTEHNKTSEEDAEDSSVSDVQKKSRKGALPAVRLVLQSDHPSEQQSEMADTTKVKIKIPPARSNANAEQEAIHKVEEVKQKRLVNGQERTGDPESFIDVEAISSGDEGEGKNANSKAPSTTATTPAPSNRPETASNATPARSLVTSLGIVSNDDHIRMILPIPTPTQTSHAMTVPQQVRSLNLRLLLLSSHQVSYTITGTQTMLPGDRGMRTKTLAFKMGGATVFDCLVGLENGVNAFEFVVLGGLNQGGMVSQKVSLFMNRV